MTKLSWARLVASLSSVAFALLGGALLGAGGLARLEVVLVVASVLAAFLPTAWCAPGGWQRRAAELAIVPAALAFTLVGDPTLRRITLPPLLVLAALAAVSAALPRATPRARPILVMLLAVSARLASVGGLVGESVAVVLLVFAAGAFLGWVVSRSAGMPAGVAVAVLGGTLPLEKHLFLTIGVALLAAGAGLVTRPPRLAEKVGGAWRPALLGAALVSSSLACWGGIPVARAFPSAGWSALAALGVAGVLTPWLSPALGGAVWLAATMFLGPMQAPTPDRAALHLTAENPAARLPASRGGLYVADITMSNATGLRDNTVVATLQIAGKKQGLVRAGMETAEWAHERDDVIGKVAHALPADPIWRPAGVGKGALWAVAGRISGVISEGVEPVVRRNPNLPARVSITISTAGPAIPTPPRDWPVGAWILAAALAVAVLQLASGTWRRPFSFVPWALLVALSLVARMPVEPLRLVGERHGIDVAFAAFLAAWLPAAHKWLRERRFFLVAAALLLPLAVATTHLVPPQGDEPYHFLLLRSLRADLDVDPSNNYDVARFPQDQMYITPKGWYLHSPVLALLVFPGYLIAGRAGVGVLLGLAGSCVLWFVARRARELGVPQTKIALVASLLLLGYPLATFSSQLWPEIIGALLIAAALAAVAAGRHPLWSSALAVLGTWIKSRLGVVLLPLAVAAWWPARSAGKIRRKTFVALALTAVAAFSLSAIWFGNVLDTIPGRRQFTHLIPRSFKVVFSALFGLAFDPAGGLVAAAPLLLVALLGVATLWRQRGKGERALLVGLALTVAALLSNQEWRGGDSPPARYLVPLIPAFALAGAVLLRQPRRWHRLCWVLLPPTLFAWWVFMTRPFLGFNAGTGGFWLPDALARRFAADARRLFPSFLLFRTSTWLVPLIWLVFAVAAWLLARRWGSFGRGMARAAVTVWLLAGAALVLTLQRRVDWRVELEDPQVERLGGVLYPPEGQMSRYLFRNGWMVANGGGVVAPLNLADGVTVSLQAWIESKVVDSGTVVASWDEGPGASIPLVGKEEQGLQLPPAPGPGKHRLRLMFYAPPGGLAVLDRVAVLR